MSTNAGSFVKISIDEKFGYFFVKCKTSLEVNISEQLLHGLFSSYIMKFH